MTVVINGTTGISGVAGTASAPALVGSDADSGFFINSANEPSASVNGTAVWNAASTFGFKNRLINGGMVIDQRNAGASVTATDTTNAVYLVDRWAYRVGAASKLSFQQSSTAPAGFKNSMLVTSLSAYSVGASEFFNFRQPVEGLNVSDIGWGTASAQPLTLSFWVRSSLTGTFGGYTGNSADNRFFVFSYTINSANTWEQKTVTIAGDTSGTWLTTNGVGLALGFSLGAGSTYQGSTGTWGSSVLLAPTGQTNVAGTSGATFYITGVQLEKGSTATSFDYRPYGTELSLCQRYYYHWSPAGTICYGPTMHNITVSETYGVFFLPVSMRTTPTMTTTGTASNYGAYQGGTQITCSSVPYMDTTNTQTPLVNFKFASGLTAGGTALVRGTNSVGFLGFVAEL